MLRQAFPMRLAQNPDPMQFGEADLESELLGESDARCSYPPPAPVSGISMLRTPDEEQPASSDSRITLRAPPPSSALLELSGIESVLAEREEPLRETREPFRQAVRDTWPAASQRTAPPPPDIEEALRRAARTSFASASAMPEATDRLSGVRVSAPHSIEEAVLRVVESADLMSEPLREPLPFKLPKA
jgi:hypothetical protein